MTSADCCGRSEGASPGHRGAESRRRSASSSSLVSRTDRRVTVWWVIENIEPRRANSLSSQTAAPVCCPWLQPPLLQSFKLFITDEPAWEPHHRRWPRTVRFTVKDGRIPLPSLAQREQLCVCLFVCLSITQVTLW